MQVAALAGIWQTVELSRPRRLAGQIETAACYLTLARDVVCGVWCERCTGQMGVWVRCAAMGI